LINATIYLVLRKPINNLEAGSRKQEAGSRKQETGRNLRKCFELNGFFNSLLIY
jgi:hypothetical protein